MSFQVRASITAMAPGLTTSFAAQGGVEPYSYSVLTGGAGGSIDPVTGLYTAPAAADPDPKKSSDVIQAEDADGDVTTASILVADPLFLVCEILWRELGLNSSRVFIWNQKKMQPTDDGMFITVGVLNCKPFGSSTRLDAGGAGLDAVQSLNMLATLSINVMSRSTEALLRKEEVLLALAGLYSQSQQELNSFYIGKLPPGGQFVSLSNIDGAAIPYRFNLSINIQYCVRKTKAANYFGEFGAPSVVTEP